MTSQGGNNRSLSCLRVLFRHHQQQKNHHAVKTHAQLLSAEPKPRVDGIGTKKWTELDSRQLGIQYGVIPYGAWTVMKVLRSKGFKAYLVGGCVRDLLLKRTPKDFDVITTATLQEIKKQFHRSEVVGQRFPICVVHIQNNITEVSSFETVAKNSEEKKEDQQKSDSSTRRDLLKENCMKRDFTINSLFFDPFSHKVYDYSNGISDLRSLKLRTIIPAKESFEEDCARILRGLRIAARLGLSFSKETETALHELSQSIMKLAKARLLMELNYMFSYGAAVPSLCLLQRFNLLETLLPQQAVYLEQQSKTRSGQNSSMLMKLLSNLDKLVSCQHPCDCRLWVGLLAFHLTLVHNPQDALVVLTLASILYHGEWEAGLRHAKENAQSLVHFEPELSGSFESESDEELSGDVSQLASFVQKSVEILTDPEFLLESLSRGPTSTSPGLVFIPCRIGHDVADLFEMAVRQMPGREKKRENFSIDYNLLGKREMWETRFALGKIILETMGCKTLQTHGEDQVEDDEEEVGEDNFSLRLSSILEKYVLVKKPRKNSIYAEVSEEKKLELNVGGEVVDVSSSSSKELVTFVGEMLGKRSTNSQDERVTENKGRDDVKALRQKIDEMVENDKEHAEKKSKRCESLDGAAIGEEERDEDVNKKQKRESMVDEKTFSEEISELLDEKLIEEKKDEHKSEDYEMLILEEITELIGEELTEEKKNGDAKNEESKRMVKGVEKKKNRKRKKHKSKDDEKPLSGEFSELLDEKVTKEKKSRDVKKNKKRKSKRMINEKGIIEKKQNDGNLTSVVVVEKKNDVDNNKVVVSSRKSNMDEDESKRVVANKNKTLRLSGLFC